MNDSDLDFETHLQYYQQTLGNSDEVRDYVHKEAQHNHALCILNALYDIALETVTISGQLKAKDATYYMRHGAGRRLLMIWRSYRTITLTAPPDREKPLSGDEQTTLGRDINVIYMHLRGALDNFAWCFLYEKEPLIAENIRPIAVSLFSQEIRNMTGFPEFWREVDAHAAWADEVKSRRDPVAHRIPLYIPYTVMAGEEEANEYQELMRKYYERSNEGDFEESDILFEQTHRLGRFWPCFVHHPEDGYVSIYPTLPSDMMHLVRLAKIVMRHIT